MTNLRPNLARDEISKGDKPAKVRGDGRHECDLIQALIDII